MTAPPDRTRSQGWREVLRVCLVVLVTFATLAPVIWVAIAQDVEGWIAELALQAVVVAGIITKIISVPAVDHWLGRFGLSRAQAGVPPVPHAVIIDPPAKPNG